MQTSKIKPDHRGTVQIPGAGKNQYEVIAHDPDSGLGVLAVVKANNRKTATSRVAEAGYVATELYLVAM